jgi:hypothetical protein
VASVLREPGTTFIVFAQAARVAEPRKGAFDHPKARQETEASVSVAALADGQANTQRSKLLGEGLSLIGVVGPDETQGVLPIARVSGHDLRSAERIGGADGMDHHAKEVAQGICPQVTFAPIDLLDAIHCGQDRKIDWGQELTGRTLVGISPAG